MTELHGLQLRRAELEARGAKLVAVSVDPVEQNREVAERLKLDYPILSDPGLAATDAFGLRHPGGNPFKSGKDADIPRPATYVFENGVVTWRDLTDNFRVRTNPQRVVDAVDADAH
jgi:peroxiredoxin